MEIIINGRFLTQSITGVQRYAHEVVKALDRLIDTRPEIKITVLSPRLSTAQPSWRNIVLREVGFLRGHAWEQLELPLHCRGKTLFCPGNTAPIISLFVARVIVVTIHDLSYRYFPESYHWAFRLWYAFIIPLILSRATSLITVSDSERREITARYPAVALRLHAIQNGGLPGDLLIDTTGTTDQSDNYILYVGSPSKRKNFSRLLEAACRLARKRGLNFVFVGGPSRSLISPVTQIPDDVSFRFKFIGQVDETPVLISYYRKARCFLFPTLYESSALPPLEAMACGCPVVVSNIPALQERCGDAAIYCDPYDIDSITTAVERVIDDEELRARLRVLGQQRAASYSWERCARETLDLICKCINDENASSQITSPSPSH